jgi:hypothetical protein
MTVDTKANLLNRATNVREAFAGGVNSARYVGQLLLDIIDSLFGKSSDYDALDYGLSTAASATLNTIALQAAIDAIWTAGGGVLRFRQGTYQFNGQVTWRDGVTIAGAGMRGTVLDFSSKPAFNYDNGIFVMQGGGRSNVQSVTASVALGALAIPVANGSGFASGDIVQLRSTENYVVADGGTRAEFLRVRYVSGNTVYVTTPTVEPYDTGLGTVQLAKVSLATGGVFDLTLKGKGSNPLGWPTPDPYTSVAEVNDASQNTRGD